jgi:ABC-type Fe2+-enterobactin transport system substrate-binding protein
MFSSFKSLAALCAVSTLFVSLVAIGTPAVQDQKKSQLEGVWKVTEVVPPASTANEKPTSITTPQPGLIIFTKGYYSGMAVTANQPRTAAAAAKDPSNLTDAEKIARFEQWAPFIANAGTYDVKGSILTLNAMVAKNPDMMSTAQTWEFKFEGANTFWLIPPADRATTSPRVKFTRLE